MVFAVKGELFMFNERLKQLRKRRKMTQQELAAALGIDRTTITKYETQSAIPPLEAVKNICAYFKVSMDYMLDTKLDGKIEEALDKRVIILQRAADENNLTERELQDILDYAMYRYPGRFRGLKENGEDKV